MKKIIFILPILLIVLFFCINTIDTDKELVLIGNKEMNIYLNEEFKDPGVNIEDVKIERNVDTKKEGTYKLIYTYKDQSIERTIHVVDPHRMIMNLNGDENTYVNIGEKYIESGCHVIDKKDGNVSDNVKIEGKVNTQSVGDYTITYSITHNHLSIKRKRIIHVVDKMKKNTNGTPVLMYHYIYTKDNTSKNNNVNYLLDTKLEEQLKYLTQNDYYFPSYQELEAYTKGEISLPKKSVILTFDDGEKGFLKYGIPLLEKYKVPATSFIIASKAEDKITKYASEYVSFQSHSYNMQIGGGNIGHGGIISVMSKNQIIDDLKKAQQVIHNTEAFAYPYGDVTEDAKKALKEAHVLCGFTTHYGRVKVGDDPTFLPRVRVLGNASLESYIYTIK